MISVLTIGPVLSRLHCSELLMRDFVWVEDKGSLRRTKVQWVVFVEHVHRISRPMSLAGETHLSYFGVLSCSGKVESQPFSYNFSFARSSRGDMTSSSEVPYLDSGTFN